MYEFGSEFDSMKLIHYLDWTDLKDRLSLQKQLEHENHLWLEYK